MPEFMSSIGFNGNEVIEAVLPLAPTTGTFVGQICRNASFYPVIWNGSSWIQIQSSIGYAWKNFTGAKIDGGTATVAASSARTTIAGQRGTGLLMHTTSYGTGVSFTYYVDTGVVACRPMNVAYVSVAYNDTNVPANNGSTLIGHYTDIETAMLKYANMGSSGEKYLVYVNAGNYTLNSLVEIPEHICLHLAPGVNISGTGTLALLNGAKLIGGGHIGCKTTAIGLSLSCTVEADTINDIGICGRAKIKCNTLRNITVSVSENDMFDVHVDCIEIGTVKTSFYDLDSTLQSAPNIMTGKVIVNNPTPLYCVCANSHGNFTCPHNTPCIVGAAGQSFTQSLLEYYANNAKLTIRANKRMTTSKFFVTVGTVRATYFEHVNPITDSPENYVTGLDSGSYPETSSLNISNANERTVNLGYQLSGGATLRLNHVKHQSIYENMEANIYKLPSEGSARLSLKSTMLIGDTQGANVVGNTNGVLYLASFDSFGSNITPSIDCIDVLGTTLQNSSEHWI